MGLRTDIALRLVKGSFNGRFKIARMTRIPVVGHAIDFAFFQDDDIIILPKDQVFAEAKKRTIKMDVEIGHENMVLPSQAIDHFLDRSRYIFLMDKCVCRDANQCEHYPREVGCIFLGRGTKRIPPHLGHMIGKDEAKEHLRKAREAGLVHLIGRDKIDSVVFSTGPKEELLSICSCCPCCCLWKMVPDLDPRIGQTLTRMPGVEVAADLGRCKGCGRCVKENVCYVRALSMEDGKVRLDRSICKGCGRCVEFCPHKAMSLSITDEGYLEETIKRIQPLVDIESE
ncbi:MAG: ferredoxin [Methanomassiliicoccales archaeon PtaU1.Bin124]|nr:MAG: ferredoxin [Methanomassiliicoccales archaeon PtaU1.Bin124]